ncbi:60S acidic ribosomal protein family [Trifolium repens]|nr:60S acidic ribosomal protein family [Trifolium repens]
MVVFVSWWWWILFHGGFMVSENNFTDLECGGTAVLVPVVVVTVEMGLKKIDSRDVYVKVGEGGDGIKDYLLLDEKEVVGCSELVANVVLQVYVKDKWRWEPDPFEGYSLKAKCPTQVVKNPNHINSFPFHCSNTHTHTHTQSDIVRSQQDPNPANMKIIAAYLLAVLGGNASPSAADIKNILGSVGVEGEDSNIELLLSEVKGKDFAELIASGREKLASVPSGGGAVAVSAAAGGGAGAAAAPAAEAKEEKKVEEKEESDDDMGFSLFD